MNKKIYISVLAVAAIASVTLFLSPQSGDDAESRFHHLPPEFSDPMKTYQTPPEFSVEPKWNLDSKMVIPKESD